MLFLLRDKLSVLALAIGSLVVVGILGCAVSERTLSADGRTCNPDPTRDTGRFKIVLKQPPHSDRVLIAVVGLNQTERALLKAAEFDEDRWKRLFGITVAGMATSQTPAMLGDYRIEDGFIAFEPRFPFRRGLRYHAVFNPERLPRPIASSAEEISFAFLLPKPASIRTAVTTIYPSRSALPENQLKFYIHFSAPMARGEAYDRIHLLDESEEEIKLAFLELQEELWDDSGTRLTLLFDPGRIKRGLRPREEMGPALRQGKLYTLVIDSDWSDAAGDPLTRTFRKRFRVIAADHTQPNTNHWKIAVPGTGTTDQLVIQFAEPLDHAMLERVLRVLDSSGRPVPGMIQVDAEETRWRLHPNDMWRAGSYSLEVAGTLEDLAGNSIARPFEVDRSRPHPLEVTAETVSISFEVENSSD